MPAYAVIGGQWGDEGKGKVIDYLCEHVTMVARYSGGNNAGHTVLNASGEFKFHLMPSGVIWPQVTPVIGNGVVVDPHVLIDEINDLRARGIDVSKLQVSDRAHIIMPYHVRLDQLEEIGRGQDALGTTGRGVGPAYVDRVARAGIRFGDVLDAEGLLDRLTQATARANLAITKLHEAEPFDIDELFAQCLRWRDELLPFIAPVEERVREALSRGENVLLEGAQGTLLDLDHGTYPYVTSSHSSIGGACAGLGIGPRSVAGVFGVFKAYTSRVGAGPMPTELNDDMGEAIRTIGSEFGTTTGRPRRCGWFDGVASRYGVIVNDLTAGILTRLDVLDGFNPVRVCRRLRAGWFANRGFLFPCSPAQIRALEQCKPHLPGLRGVGQADGGTDQLGRPAQGSSGVRQGHRGDHWLLDRPGLHRTTPPRDHQSQAADPVDALLRRGTGESRGGHAVRS